jgi:molybdopterin-containing oxidoreductase family iron-sulfur binding subunit
MTAVIPPKPAAPRTGEPVSEHPLQWHASAPAIGRRRALQLMAASLALAGGACSRAPAQRVVPAVQGPEAGIGGLPLYYASAVLRDGHAQGVLIGTREGRPIKVEGNPAHPASLGATDVFAQAAVLQLWDPDRAQAVMQRLPGSRGGPAAVSTWDAFAAAWQQQATAHAADSGARLRLLTGRITSPTLRAQIAALLQRFPRARWHRHVALDDTAQREGARLAFGRVLQPVWHFDRAAFVLALAADPFSDGPGAVRHAADWVRRRAATRDRPGACTLAAAEAVPGLFGARADERMALAPAGIEALLWRIAHGLFGDALPSPPGPPPEPALAALEARWVQRLRSTGPDSLLIAGDCLSPQAHALVHAMNQRLGAAGRTVDLIAPTDRAAEVEPLADLLRDCAAGQVDTLIVLDCNPLHEAAPALDVAGALQRVPFSAHLGLYRDETAQLCSWQLPLSHGFESWSDATAHDGSATVIQPAIAPLYDSRSAHELLALLQGEQPDGHALVRAHWQAGQTLKGEAFDAFWHDSLRAGVIANSAPAPLPWPRAALPRAGPAGAMPLAAVFMRDPAVDDGRLANNAWLQELPRPFTKITWGNALLLGPATARALGLAAGDVVRATANGRTVEAPVWVHTRQAEGVVALPVGYGRRQAGRVGNGVGFDAYPLRSDGPMPVAITLQVTGRHHAFAVTQHTMGQDGRELARSVRPGEALPPEPPQASLYGAHPSPQHAWGMVIDLDACIGCNACSIACQAENNIPVVGAEEVARGREMHWIRIDHHAEPDGAAMFQPVPCMHCENAPCELVCPVGATVHDSEGLNVQVYNRCIGTRFCSNNCPYKVRRFNFLPYTDELTESLKAQRNPQVTVRQRGVMEKCSYCVQRITQARHQAELSGQPLADGDVVTACQAVCPTRAIHFGDLNDPKSEVVQAKASPRHYAMLGELNTRPRTTYLARVSGADEDPRP